MIYLYRCLGGGRSEDVSRRVEERHYALPCGFCGHNMILEVQPVAGRVTSPAVPKKGEK